MGVKVPLPQPPLPRRCAAAAGAWPPCAPGPVFQVRGTSVTAWVAGLAKAVPKTPATGVGLAALKAQPGVDGSRVHVPHPTPFRGECWCGGSYAKGSRRLFFPWPLLSSFGALFAGMLLMLTMPLSICTCRLVDLCPDLVQLLNADHLPLPHSWEQGLLAPHAMKQGIWVLRVQECGFSGCR